MANWKCCADHSILHTHTLTSTAIHTKYKDKKKIFVKMSASSKDILNILSNRLACSPKKIYFFYYEIKQKVPNLSEI